MARDSDLKESVAQDAIKELLEEMRKLKQNPSSSSIGATGDARPKVQLLLEDKKQERDEIIYEEAREEI